MIKFFQKVAYVTKSATQVIDFIQAIADGLQAFSIRMDKSYNEHKIFENNDKTNEKN